jgi:hypothetical protein
VVVSATALIASKCSPPIAELARLRRVVEDEDRRALHELLDDRRLDAAALAQQAHAAVVARDQRASRSSHRHEEVALACSPTMPSGPARPIGTWANAHEVLDVARQNRGSNEKLPTCSSAADRCASWTKRRRASAISRV